MHNRDMCLTTVFNTFNFSERTAPVALFFAMTLFCSLAHATCSRSDIDYYLEKGFTREQVTALCSEGSAPPRERDSRYQGYDDLGERYQRETEQRLRIQEEMSFLKSSIAGRDIKLTPRRLEYTRKFCLAAGKTPEVEGRTRVCPDVRYHIYFKDLEVGAYERKYFFLGRREIEVTGKVRRKMLHDLSEYPADLKRDLLATYKYLTREDGTAIPVRRDVPINRVTEILSKYARRATEQEGSGERSRSDS